MTVLTDAYTPPREELTRMENLRGEMRGSLHDHAPDLNEVRGTHELHEKPQTSDTDPHGMYWHRTPDGALVLRPHAWFIKYIATQADAIFGLTRDAIGQDPDVHASSVAIGNALREYVELRGGINSMVVARKFKQELDDASYQFCQAAKYRVDAEERAKFLVERDQDILDNEQINSLVDRAQQAAHEGFVLAYAIRHAGFDQSMNFEVSARRVLDYSCRRLTEWFAQRRKNTESQTKLSNAAALSIVNNLFTPRGRK